jgi:hypothetical protein
MLLDNHVTSEPENIVQRVIHEGRRKPSGRPRHPAEYHIREHQRFQVPGAFVRIDCKTFAIVGATAAVSPAGMLGKFYRLFAPHCEVLNLSRGGIAFQTALTLVEGKRVTVALRVPGEAEPVQLEGEVRWRKRGRGKRVYDVGVRFAPFGHREGCNPPDALAQLQKIEERFGK